MNKQTSLTALLNPYYSAKTSLIYLTNENPSLLVQSNRIQKIVRDLYDEIQKTAESMKLDDSKKGGSLSALDGFHFPSCFFYFRLHSPVHNHSFWQLLEQSEAHLVGTTILFESLLALLINLAIGFDKGNKLGKNTAI